jgi:molecular chaperone GrpE
MSNPTTNENPASAGPTDPAAKADGHATETEGQNGDALLGQLQADLERFRDLALRSQADFDNFRKRATREKEEAVKYANVSLLERLIPIVDNFELGLAAARGSAEGSAIILGLDMVGKQLADFLTQCGVEPVAAEGQKFDPNQHEAFAQEESATVHEGGVVRQLRKGYRLKDRLLRPAAVVVSKGAPAPQA